MADFSVYVNTSGCENWILKIIADDIVEELQKMGYKVRKGPYEDYKDEDVAYHMWWRIAVPYTKAKINSVFITHTDDSMKEADLSSMANKFDSFVTMSPEDAQFLVDIGFDKKKVYGVNLAVRNNYIRPVSLGVFSSCYPDNRKNENWLLEYCEKEDVAKIANYIFIGQGWGGFVEKLSKLDCTFEWHCTSRSFPNEYFFQQLKMSTLDYYIYMGMDGGAMGTYDAYAMGARLCIADDGYHKGIPDIDFKFETKEQFFQSLDKILLRQKRKLDFYNENSITNYAKKLLAIWGDDSYTLNNNTYNNDQSTFASVAEKRRHNYFKWNMARLRQSLAAFIRRKRTKQI